MHKKLRFLLSGPGLIGKVHALLIAANDACETVAVVAPDTEENRQLVHALGANYYPRIETALDAEQIDGAVISSPNAFHFEQAMTCIQRDVPCLVEKPVTDSLDTAMKLMTAAEERGVPVMVGHHRAYSPFLDAALEFLRSDRFGRLVTLQGSAVFLKPDHYFEDGPWRALPGGGPILINLIHEIGLMREFAGDIAQVHALASHAIRGFPVEDTMALSLRFVSGALGTFILSDAAASSKSWEMTSGENPAYPHFPEEACYHFAGTNGALDFPSMKAKSYSGADARSWWTPFDETVLPVLRRDPLEAQIDHLVAVVRGEATPRVSARDGYRNMQVIEAIQRSIETGTIVAVE